MKEIIDKLIKDLDIYHNKSLFRSQALCSGLCSYRMSYFGDFIKSLSKYERIRKFDACYKFTDELLRYLNQYHKDANGNIRLPSLCENLSTWIYNNIR